MEFSSLHHEAKSAMAYAYDANTLHLRLRAKKGSIQSVRVIAGDPFHYGEKGWVSFANEPMMHEATTEHHDIYFGTLTPPYKRVKYAFIINERYLYGSSEIIDLNVSPELEKNLFNYFNFPYILDADRFIAPAWAKEQVWLSIFPSRFNRHQDAPKIAGLKAWDDISNLTNLDTYGGTIKGITEKLDYLEDVGFTAIYLTPIFEASSQHKYDTIDYYQIDPEFGTLEDFKELVAKAHEKNIKIVLDLVFNHVGAYHPWFKDVLEKGPASSYFDYFFIKDVKKPILPFSLEDLKATPWQELRKKVSPETLNYETFAFTPFMPKVNTDHPEVSDYFIDVALFWLRETKVDGFRLDVSNEVSHRFWRAFRTALKKVQPDVYIIGENWDVSNPWLQGDQYDAVMNYGLLFPLWQTFASVDGMPQLSAQEFVERISKLITTYPKNVLEVMYNLVDSHDTSRLLTLTQGNLNKFYQAYLFMFCFPGSPSIFYGDEAGVDGGHDPKNRRPMPWHDLNQSMIDWFKSVIKLRQSEKAMRSGSLSLKAVGTVIQLVKDETLMLVLNIGGTTAFEPNAGFESAQILLESTPGPMLEKDGYKLLKR